MAIVVSPSAPSSPDDPDPQPVASRRAVDTAAKDVSSFLVFIEILLRFFCERCNGGAASRRSGPRNGRWASRRGRRPAGRCVLLADDVEIDSQQNDDADGDLLPFLGDTGHAQT